MFASFRIISPKQINILGGRRVSLCIFRWEDVDPYAEFDCKIRIYDEKQKDFTRTMKVFALEAKFQF